MTTSIEWTDAAHPVGTRVRFWTGLREGPGRVSTTRAPAACMSDHASVWITGVAGSVALSHVEVIDEVDELSAGEGSR
ncbi:hypothetical protein [Sandaracinus amylolyticus]|uniref:hypothetical protein n=1 Tax=Sandaracinus amylolyticus TaxID=927083 RepID=UPI001F2BB3AD|nr:hypothetical protein [Sandaracinus amylolyticus]UJR81440.1 Hypothetical protein I5071_34990 [Sandaracinus amylolyticus]